jgi:site-specific recombinase XerD
MVNRTSAVPTGPLAAYAEGFLAGLGDAGYSRSAAKKQLNLMVHLDRWLRREGLEVQALTSEELDRFFTGRREEGRSNLLTARSVIPLVGFLARMRVITPASPRVAEGAVEVLVDRFGSYLRHERGLVEGTVRFYLRTARRFLTRRFADSVLDPMRLSAADVTDFVSSECRTMTISSARQTVSALRSLLRFLRMEGLTVLALDQAVLSVAGWNPSLPKAVDAAQ